MSGWRKRTIMEMAKESGFIDADWNYTIIVPYLEAFEALVRADEREACAKVCESYLCESPYSWGGTTMASAIRARGEQA